MFRQTVSLLMLLTGVSLLNAQAPVKSAPAPVPKEPTLDEKIALALKHHPDIKAAEAKRALAEAELEQAKLALSQKIAVASAKVTTAKEELAVALEIYSTLERRYQSASVPQMELLLSKKNFTIAKSNVTVAETELKNLLAMPKDEKRQTAMWGVYVPGQYLTFDKDGVRPVSPDTPTKLGEALATQVALDLKNPTVPAMQDWLNKMVDGKFVLRFQGMEQIEKLKQVPQLGVLNGKMTLAACLQLYIDELNAAATGDLVTQIPYQVYVRDYGIMICPAKSAPIGAMTMTEFLKLEKGKQK